MELLSRRSSSDRMSTLKRSRSFRASMKLMSKLRSRASMRLNGGFDLSPASLQHSKRKREKLSLVEEGVVSTPANNNNNNTITTTTIDPSFENRPSRITEDNETLVPQGDRLSSTLEFESRKIAKELSKLCLTDLTTEKNRRGKSSDEISPKVTTRNIFRWRRSNGEVEEESEGKKRPPLPWTATGGHENPTFRLDASLDSSMSAFLFESENSDRVANDHCKDEPGYLEERWPGDAPFTADSKNDEARKGRESVEVDDDDDDDCRANESERDESKRGLFTGAKARSLSVNDVVLRDEEVASSLVLNSLVDDVGDASKGTRKSQSEKIRKTSVCSSKSCRIRTVDNIANFWTSARGGSFRSKVSVGRKKSIKESRDSHDSLGNRDRVLVTTTSGSSTAHQVSFF